MGFTADVSIFSSVGEIGEYSHEGLLANLDDGPSATLALLAPKATNWIIRQLKIRGVEPTTVTNVVDFKQLAADWILGRIFISNDQADPSNAAKAKFYTDKAEQDIRTIYVEGPAGNDGASLGPPLPLTFHLDKAPTFATPIDNTIPGTYRNPSWKEK